MDLVPGPFSASTIAALEAVSVVDITNPTELNSLAGTVVGERRVAYQVVGNDNLYTVYFWDSADGAGASSPYVVAGSAGYWIAAGGRYTNSAVSLRSTLLVSGAATLSSTLGVTGTSTMAAINASGDIASTSNNITLTRGTAGGTVISAKNNDTTASTSVEVSVIGTTTGGASRNAIRVIYQPAQAGGNAAYLLQSGKVSGLLFEGASTVINQREGGPLVIGVNDTEVARFTSTTLTVATPVSITSGSNSNIAQGTGWIWTSTGLSGGTIRGGIYAQSGGDLNLFGGSSITSHLAISSAGAVSIGSTLAVTSNAGIGGALSSLAVVQVGATNPLSGVTQIGNFVNMTGTSAGTSALRGAQLSLATAAASYTCAEATAFLCGSIAKGASSTITRATSAWIDPQSNGTNNCGLLIATGVTYTGSWAIRSESTNASTLAGNLSITGSQPFVDLNCTAAGGQAVRFITGGGANYNFLIGSQFNVGDTFEITPSTAVGGSSYTTPALKIAGATGVVTVAATTASTTTATGALLVTGGCGIGGLLNFNGGAVQGSTGTTNFFVQNSTTGYTTAGVVIQQAGVNTNLYNGSNGYMEFGTNNVARARLAATNGELTLTSTVDATTISTGSFQTLGGAGITKALWVGGLVNVAGVTTVANTTDATTKTNGAFTTTGGMSVGKNSIMAQGQGWGVTSVVSAAGTTVLTTASTVVQVTTGSTTQTYTLPAANAFGAGVGVVFIFKNLSTGAVTVNRAGGDTINTTATGATTFNIATISQATLVSDGVSAWEKII